MDAPGPLPRRIYEERQEGLLRRLQEPSPVPPEWKGLVAVGRSFFDRPGPVAYLTGHFPPFPSAEFSDLGRGIGYSLFLMNREGRRLLIADFHRPDRTAVDDVRISMDVWGPFMEALRELDMDQGALVLLGSDLFPLLGERLLRAQLPDVVLVPGDDWLKSMRRKKSPEEVALLREAARIGEEGLKAALGAIRVGARERDVAAEGHRQALLAGADFVRYLRVHSGPWSEYTSRWPQATDRILAEGDPVNLDIIGAYEGYQFDILRPAVAGKPGPLLQRMREALAAIQEALLALVRPGITVQHLFQKAQEVAEAHGFPHHLSSFLGHGIGLETVEEPLLIRGSREVLQPSMVLCIEPTLHVPGQGAVSVEDEVWLHEDGAQRLTSLPFLP